MTNKLCAGILTLAILVSAVLVPGYASGRTYLSIENFTSHAGGNGYSFQTGLAGKEDSDRSASRDETNQIYIAPKFAKTGSTISGITTMEFNFYRPATNWLTLYDQDRIGTILILKGSDGKLTMNNNSYEVSHTPFLPKRWNKMAIEFNAGTKKMNVYINGVKQFSEDKPIVSSFIDNANTQAGNPSIRIVTGVNYIDDIVCYPGSYQSGKASVSGKSSAVVVSADTIKLLPTSVADVTSQLNITDAISTKVLKSDLTVKSSGDIEDGDILLVVGGDSDNPHYSYYTLDVYGINFSENMDLEPTEGVSGGSFISMVSGKSSSDKSLLLSGGSYTKSSLDFTSAAKGLIEFNILKTDDSLASLSMGTTTAVPYFSSDASGNAVILNGAKIASYELGKWYKVSVDMDFANGSYDYYLNDVCVASDAALGNMANATIQFSGTCCLDNINLSSGTHSPSHPGTLTVKRSAKKDDDLKQIALNDTVDSADISNYIDVSAGSSISVVSAVDYMTKQSGNVAIGDLLAVYSPGNVYDYYTFTDKVYDEFDVVSFKAKSSSSALNLSDITSGTSVSFEYAMQNKTPETKEGYLIIVAYENNQMTYFDIQNVSLAANTTYLSHPDDCIIKSKAIFTATSTPDFIEAYFWNSMQDRTAKLKSQKLN